MEESIQDLLTAELQTLTGNGVILRLAGEIDISSVRVLSDHLEIVSKAEWSGLVIDLTDVTFMDSVGLHALIEGKRLVHERGSAIVLVTSPQVRRLFQLVFPEPMFATRVYTVEEALRLLGLDESPDDE